MGRPKRIRRNQRKVSGVGFGPDSEQLLSVRRTVVNAAAKILWVLALATAVIWYGLSRLDGDEPTYAVEQIEFSLMREIYGNNIPAQAYGTGPTVVVLYSNYLCPFCRELWDSLEAIMHDDSTSVTVHVRHLVPPVLGNPAYLAALSAECAGDQDRFDAFHRIALESQDHLSTVSFERLARQADVPDVPRFNTCVDGEIHKSRITLALEEAKYLSLAGTPAMVIGRQLVTGTPALKELRELLSPRGQTAWLD